EGGSQTENTVAADKFRELIGGADAPVLIIPTASSDESIQKSSATGGTSRFAERLGLTNLKILHTRDRQEANSEAFVVPIRTTKGIMMPGGEAGKRSAAYLETLVQKEVQAFYERGGVIDGTSAGAMIMGSYVVGGAHEGFGLLKNVAIDPHV